MIRTKRLPKPPKPPVVAERDVLAAIVEWCKANHIPCWRRNVMMMRTTGADGSRGFLRSGASGQSDLWGVLPGTGRHWECEVKRTGSKPTPKQNKWLDTVRKHGALGFWVDSVEDFAEIIGRDVAARPTNISRKYIRPPFYVDPDDLT